MLTRTLAAALMAAVLGGLVGCTVRPTVEAVVIPAYPCVGEQVSIRYTTRNVDRVVVRNRAGVLLHASSAGRGSFTISSISRDMLPLTARGFRGDQSMSFRIGPGGPYPLDVIDNEITTGTVTLTRENITESRYPAGTVCGCWVYSGRSQPCAEEFPALWVYTTTDACSEDLTLMFAQRARVTRVFNRSSRRITLEKDGQSFTLAPSASASVPGTLMARGVWTARLAEPVTEFKGLWVDVPNTSNCATAGWVGATQTVDLAVRVHVAFSVVCN